jgi:Protein of unknown function (DUF1569)
MKTLDKLLAELESTIPKHALQNDDISKASVGWHIEHLLLAINGILAGVEKSNPGDFKWSFKPMKLLIFATKKIPRGKAKSPDVVVPKYFDEATLAEHIKLGKQNLEDLKSIDSNKFFKHPVFGDLKLVDTITFLQIHTQHHIDIINDILITEGKS